MEVKPAEEGHRALLGRFVAAQQADPRSHIAYLGTHPEGIAEDLGDLEPLGWAGVLVAWSGGKVVGVLGAEWDTDPPRVWWHGPFVGADGWDRVADALLKAGLVLLPPTVAEQELAADDRNARVAAFARRHGFASEEASAVLRVRIDDLVLGRQARPGAGPAATAEAAQAFTVVPLAENDRAAVAALHDRLFPAAHLPGARIDEGADRVVLVARQAGQPVGYAAAERQSDGEGYLDFLGVEEDARGAGVGRALAAAVCRALGECHGCEAVSLTVRESNSGARRLYERLGFTEERLLRPWRLGFAL